MLLLLNRFLLISKQNTLFYIHLYQVYAMHSQDDMDMEESEWGLSLRDIHTSIETTIRAIRVKHEKVSVEIFRFLMWINLRFVEKTKHAQPVLYTKPRGQVIGGNRSLRRYLIFQGRERRVGSCRCGLITGAAGLSRKTRIKANSHE